MKFQLSFINIHSKAAKGGRTPRSPVHTVRGIYISPVIANSETQKPGYYKIPVCLYTYTLHSRESIQYPAPPRQRSRRRKPTLLIYRHGKAAEGRCISGHSRLLSPFVVSTQRAIWKKWKYIIRAGESTWGCCWLIGAAPGSSSSSSCFLYLRKKRISGGRPSRCIVPYSSSSHGYGFNLFERFGSSRAFNAAPFSCIIALAFSKGASVS